MIFMNLKEAVLMILKLFVKKNQKNQNPPKKQKQKTPTKNKQTKPHPKKTILWDLEYGIFGVLDTHLL